MNNDYERIEKAIHFIRSNVTAQPDLQQIASHLGLSAFHFQRLFSRWAGVSPKRFLEYLTVQHAKDLLRNSNSILDVSYKLGLSGAGRLHDHFISIEAVTPGDYKTQGKGLRIYYGMHHCPFGNMLLAQTARGLCALSFIPDINVKQEIDTLRKLWPNAEIIEDSTRTAKTADRIFGDPAGHNDKIHLAVRGTNFQINVWKALIKIPAGEIRSYQQIAAQLNKPGAYRAVASAIAANPVGFLIPCHRVLRGSGNLGGYRWGEDRKYAMLAWEAARNEASSDHSENGRHAAPVKSHPAQLKNHTFIIESN